MTDTTGFDVFVVGAGLIGLSVARALVEEHDGLSLAALDKESGVAHHQSGHNSGVVHSGLYYLLSRVPQAGLAALGVGSQGADQLKVEGSLCPSGETSRARPARRQLGLWRSGVRAQSVDSAGNLVDDFVIERAGSTIHVLNAPSPGATASIAIGRYVADGARPLLSG